MDALQRSERLAAEGHRLLSVAGNDLDAPVGFDIGWTQRELVDHVLNVWRAVGVLLAEKAADPSPLGGLLPPPTQDAERMTFAHETLDAAVAAVAGIDPTTPVWTWGPDQTAGFLQRRVQHETVIHRVDGEEGVGARSPIANDDAIDGIDELFGALLQPEADQLPSGSFHLHQTDGDGEFMLTTADGAIRVTHEHAKGDAALRGPAEALLLAMWGRRSIDDLDFFGDRAVADEWMGLAP